MTSHPRDNPQFYLTAPSPCPYLPGKEERKVFTHIVGKRARDLNEILTQGGFRRSQTIAYRPACESCRACVSVRVLVDEFGPSANLRRVFEPTATSSARACRTGRPPSSIRCSARYLDARHTDGGMADMTVLDYSMMVEDSHVETQHHRVPPPRARYGITGRGAGDLLAVCLPSARRRPVDGLLVLRSRDADR